MSQPVIDFYDTTANAEWNRLEQPMGRIEFASTLRLIEKHFPKGGRVCDIGSGPGRYALELARRGYRMTLFDISERSIEKAQEAFARKQLPADGFICGNARDLVGLEAETFDAALLLGPMYHVVDPIGRREVLRELWRVLKPEGVAVVAFLNSWGILRTGLTDFPERYRDETFARSMLGDVSFKGALPGFTECHWATPVSALSELHEAGYSIVTSAGAEGFATGLRPQIERLAVEDAESYQIVLRLAAETAELPQYREATDHFHVVIRK
jgi:ubiquinone/menaquinone biosynthesis C-methylase UbiE